MKNGGALIDFALPIKNAPHIATRRFNWICLVRGSLLRRATDAGRAHRDFRAAIFKHPFYPISRFASISRRLAQRGVIMAHEENMMQINQLAAQLYTLRDFCKTPQDIAQTLKRVRAIGYEAVQVSGVAPIPATDLKAMLDDNGLTCCATHEATSQILEETPRVIERLQQLDCKFTAIPSPGNYDLSTRKAVLDFAARADAAGKAMHEANQTLCYHNHHFEFARFDEKPILEILYDETDPRYLQGEPDLYWIQYGGASPLEWCEKLAGRLPLVHLKDYGIGAQNKPVFREIGRGNLNWNAILPAVEKSGCQWFIVEQDICERDPFESLQISFEYLQTHCGEL